MKTRICFVRHGETDWNVEKRIQGHLDIPLNATGRAQALALGFTAAHYQFKAIYSSDLLRAMETAQAIAARDQLAIHPLAQLRERHYGIFQGITAAEGAQRHPAAYSHYMARSTDYDFESGESMHTFVARIEEAIRWMVRHHHGETLCAVCHAGVLDILYRRATGRPLDTPRDFTIPNGSLNWFRCDEQGWELEKWADRHHLQHVLGEVAE